MRSAASPTQQAYSPATPVNDTPQQLPQCGTVHKNARRQDTSQNDVNLASSQPPQGDAAGRSPLQQQQDTPRHVTSLTDVNHRNPQTTTNHRTTTPPIWQGRARGGESAAILGRNPDGTFQVSLNGVEKTFKEPQVAAMTRLKKGPLYEMLGQATKGRLADKVPSGNSPTGNGLELLPKTENSSFYKTDRSAESRGTADRAAENRRLMDARPPRRHPPERTHAFADNGCAWNGDAKGDDSGGPCP